MTRESSFRLKRWRIIQVDSGEHHLVGFAEIAADGYAEGRVSSPIRAFDSDTMIVTRSSNRYELVGPKGRDPDADWVLEHWLWVERDEGRRR